MKRSILFTLSLLISTNLSAAEPKDDRITVTYELSDLLYKPGSTKSGYDSLDEVTKEIMTLVNPKSWLLAPDGGNRLFEVNGNKLEIRATKKDHNEIKDLIQSLRIMNDLTIDVKTTFLSVEAKWFAKELEPLLKKEKKLTDDEEEVCPKERAVYEELFKKAEVVQTGKIRQGSRRTGSIASLRQAHTFATGMVEANGEPVWGVEYIGISYRAKTTVSPDRRFIKFEIDETCRESATPKIKEKTTTVEITLPDGGTYLRAVPYTTKTIADRGRILLLKITPEIYIDAEDKERRGKKDDG